MIDTQQLVDQFSLPEERLDYYHNGEQSADCWRWQCGYDIIEDHARIADTCTAEFKAVLSDTALARLIKDLQAKGLRQAAHRAGVTRSTASRRKNNAEFYSGLEQQFNFTWHQYDAIKAAGAEWEAFVVDVLLVNMEKFGGEWATVEAIRAEAKKWRGVDSDSDGEDGPQWKQDLTRAINAMDAARKDDTISQADKHLIVNATNVLVGIIEAWEKRNDATKIHEGDA